MLFEKIHRAPDEAIAQALEYAVSEAKALWNLEFEGEYPAKGIGISELRPAHVGEPVSDIDIWMASTGTTYSFVSWFDIIVNEQAFIVVEGLFMWDPDPKVHEIALTVNGIQLPVINIDQTHSWESGTIYLPKPIIVRPYGTIKIELLCSENKQHKIGVLGHTIAKRAYLINKAATVGS